MLRIDHTCEIEAPAEGVWRVLTDFEAYGEWNPFVVAAKSRLEVGAAMDMRVRVLPFMTQSQREWITSVEPGVGFCYGLAPRGAGALSSERCHRITAEGPNRCRYESRFAIDGWLSGIIGGLLGRQLRRGFTEMSAAVKARAESLARAES
jgi:uncharacterized protein YndB with AHSA1/START domain